MQISKLLLMCMKCLFHVIPVLELLGVPRYLLRNLVNIAS